MNKIIAKNISKNYKTKHVLHDISLNFSQGEIVGLLGPNGAGKTTFFYSLLGLVRISSGEIFINDIEISQLPMHQRSKYGLAYLPQENSIFRDLSVEDNIKAILQTKIHDKSKLENKLNELLNQFGLTQLRKTKAIALSGGERRRTEIARSLALEPEFIFLDEPFAGIDPIAVQEIMKIMQQLKNEGLGVFITDHNVRETLKIVDRAYIIYDGNVLIEGSPEEIINDSKVREIYLGEGF